MICLLAGQAYSLGLIAEDLHSRGVGTPPSSSNETPAEKVAGGARLFPGTLLRLLVEASLCFEKYCAELAKCALFLEYQGCLGREAIGEGKRLVDLGLGRRNAGRAAGCAFGKAGWCDGLLTLKRGRLTLIVTADLHSRYHGDLQAEGRDFAGGRYTS